MLIMLNKRYYIFRFFNEESSEQDEPFGCDKSDAGFTLIEVLIALVVLGIALIPLLVSMARAVGDYSYANNSVYETILAKKIMSNVFLLNNIYIMNKTQNIPGAKGYSVKKTIGKTSYPGIYMIKITVFKKGHNPKSGVTLKSLAQ